MQNWTAHYIVAITAMMLASAVTPYEPRPILHTQNVGRHS